MPEFLTLYAPEAALNLMLTQLEARTSLEWVATSQALGRVTASPVAAPHPLPTFRRSTVDGYALRAADTFGASESLPAYLHVIGEVPMGAKVGLNVPPANCALIHTGGMLPEAADAVVMLEYTQVVKPGEIEILKATATGENVIRIGEDVETGQEVIPAGSWLRPAEIGGLAALGITKVAVMCRPRVAILSTGDEVVPLEAAILPGQVHDVNSYTLSALIERSGGQPVNYGILPDTIEALENVARQALEECDIVVFTAGSSASTRDLTAQVINGLGTPGVLVHGVNVRPGKPTILGVCSGKAIIGLPGNPVSALVIAGLFIAPIIAKQLGVVRKQLKPSVRAKLSVNLASQAGREDWIPVRLTNGIEGYQADPIFGKSNLIFTLARADGLLCIPQDATGLHAGEIVEVFLSI
jgi:molybdopterin molybdotransferase